MNRDEVLETLRKHKQVLRKRFDVTGLALLTAPLPATRPRPIVTSTSSWSSRLRRIGVATSAPRLTWRTCSDGQSTCQLSGKYAAPYDPT